MAAARVGRQAGSSCAVQLLLVVAQCIWEKCAETTAPRPSAAAGRLTLPLPCRRRRFRRRAAPPRPTLLVGDLDACHAAFQRLQDRVLQLSLAQQAAVADADGSAGARWDAELAYSHRSRAWQSC